MTSVEIGRAAEATAVMWLSDRGFTILDRNWRTRWCEIDIIARGGDVIHFIEVKFRRRPDFGSGTEYITADKQRRLLRSAHMWVHRYAYCGDYQIDVIAVDGSQHCDYIPNAIDGG